MTVPRVGWSPVAGAALVLALGGFFGLRWLAHQDERDEALRLAEKGPFAEAEPLLRRVLERSPRDAEVVRALALGYLEARRFDETEDFLGRWCALRPGLTGPYRRRLDLWRKQARVAPAI